MSKALYRKYRSKSLSEVVGQGHITDLLSRSLKADRVAHAYLFTGPRGVGKTSIARILAHEINKLPYSEDTQHLDIIEIDAASNNGVEDVRDLREKVQIAPVSAAKKVYIIDEVHMLSKPAFNALLKTLEEPPAHIVFILATTNAEKLPATIISRTQQYGFRAIAPADAIKHLQHIAKEEKITISDDALALIAERGDGSFRDSISLLDQLSSLTDDKEGITAQLVELSLGLAPNKAVSEILDAVQHHDVAKIAQVLTTTESDGISSLTLCDQLITAVRAAALEKHDLLPLLDALLDVPKSSYPAMKLLSVLGMAASEHKPKNAALRAPVAEVTATIEELSIQATRKKPQMKEQPAVTAPAAPKTVAPKEAAPAPTVASSDPETPPSDAPFSWTPFLEHIRQNCVALYSVLVKCSYEADEANLTIYTNNAFHKKKIDDAKYSPHLYESLKVTGGYGLNVHTVPTGPPMKNSQAASIADMMGGGTEVSLEATA